MYFLLFIVLVPIIVAVACRFVQKTTVRIEELEIDYEQNCMKDVPIPLTPLFFLCHYLINHSFPLGKERRFWMTP